MASIKATNEQFPVRLTKEDLGELVHGADWNTFAFQIMEDDNVTAVDTTGWECHIYLLESENGEEYDHLTNGDGITMTAASGLFVVDVPYSTVDTWNFRTCLLKTIMIDDEGTRIPYFIGRLNFAEV